MKKFNLIAITAATLFALTGCQNTSDREALLEEQVAALEQQVTDLESGDNVAIEPPTTEDTLDSLTELVNNVVKEANEASPAGSNEEKQTKYFEIKNTLQEAENRLDRYEDKIEKMFRNGELAVEQARNEEMSIEKLEDLLDNAEDRLEYVFGYDD